MLVALLLGTLPLQAGSIPDRAELLENGAYVSTLVNRIRAAKKRFICVCNLFKIGESAGDRPRAEAGELIAAQRRGVEVTVILEGGNPV